MPHLKAVQLISWGRSCSLDSYSLLAQLRVSKFFVAENGVYWCSHKTDKNCHFYGDKWWLDPIDRCFFKGTSTVFSDNLNISQFCLTFLCPGWNSPCALSLARWGSYSSELPAKVQLGWVVPIHWADLNSVFVRTLYSWLGGFIYTIYIYYHIWLSSFSNPYITIFSFKLKILLPSKHDRKHLWFLDMLQKGAVKRSARQLHWHSIS